MFQRISKLAVMAVLFGVFCVQSIAGESDLQFMTLEGRIIQKITHAKNGRDMTYYYLETDDDYSLRLANQVKGKKSFEEAIKIDLKDYVDKRVILNVKATKTKSGKPSVRVITSLTAV